MDAVLKKNIRQMLILMLISAAFGLLSILLMVVADSGWWDGLPVCGLFIYILSCVLVWIQGTVKVIWQLPLKRVWRIILGFVWLMIYPILAYLWLGCCIFCIWFLHYV